ncbi:MULTISPECIES: helix-turn-helix transcriptional regulator [unclassified Microbacterium]|uniref:helix-turn-helix transcriptional regulator n=1 Tax=unclassified Microbacterium TaxID=2609290 RepID=UPI00386F6BBC
MTTGRPASYNAISTYSRVEILHLLQTHPQQTIGELVTATGLHANTVREHLQRLIERGFVATETEKRTVRGRPRVFYRAVDGASVSSDEHRRKVQAARERGDLMRRVMPSTEGTLVPEEQHQLDALVEQLLDGGFEPVVDEDTLQIDLAQCDHAEAQASHTKTLCDVHLGLMRGALREAGGPLAVDAERSSCDPRDCVIRLMRRTPDGAHSPVEPVS